MARPQAAESRGAAGFAAKSVTPASLNGTPKPLTDAQVELTAPVR